MEGGAILAVVLLISVIVLSTVGLTFMMFGADRLESKEMLEPSLEIQIKGGVSDTTFVYTKIRQ